MAPIKKTTKTKTSVAEKTAPKTVKAKKLPAIAKKAPAKKTATKARVPAAKVASKGVSKAASCANKLTRVLVKYDAGWGNQVFIRGVGAGLDWQKGILMQCIGDDEWLWEARVPCGSISFKLLVNDGVWSQGEDVSVLAGETVICHPSF